MKKSLVWGILSLIPTILFADDRSVDQIINDTLEPVTDVAERIIFVAFNFNIDGQEISVPAVLVWLIVAAIFFTVSFKFVNFTHFKTAIDVVRGKHEDLETNAQGEVTHFQALTAALSATVGLGNIAGVAVAVALGGPGATFWMIVAGLLGMSTKFVECTLGVKYRLVNPETGVVSGGPMYYLRDGFASMKMDINGETFSFAKMGKFLAIIFSIACIGGSIGAGNMFQAKSAFDQVSSVLPDGSIFKEGFVFGILMAALVGVVIIGGIKSIAKVTDKIVPFMAITYVLAAIAILILKFDLIPQAFGLIITSAFSGKAITGGVIGVLIQGFKRAAFSNEAGVGSASIAHSAVKTNYPASEGLVGLIEPFVDTVVICTMTALVLIVTGTYDNSLYEGIELTSFAMSSVLGPTAHYILTIAAFLFAFSTMISWSYYGTQAWMFIFGKSKKVEIIYKVIFCLLVIVGCASDLSVIVRFADVMIFLMAFPNVIGLYFLYPVVKSEFNKYKAAIKKDTV